MSSTDLSSLLISPDTLSLGDANLEVVPDDAFLSSNSLLTILAAFDPSFADLVASVSTSLPEATGQILITDGLLDVNLLLADGTTLAGRFDAPTTLGGFADLAAVSNGTVTLTGGILEAALTVDDQVVAVEGFDLAAVASALVLDTINAVDATLPFTNGAFTLDLETALGPVSGLVDVAGGDLNIDLSTPFGQIAADIDFGPEAVVPFSMPVPLLGTINGVVDFDSGTIIAPLGFLGNLTVPIAALSGSLSLVDGVASLNTTVPFAGTSVPVATDIALGPLASEYVAGFLQDLTATATITDGVLDASVTSPLGLFETVFDVVAFTNQGADFFAGIDGVIDLGGGIATAAITTPLGDINGSFDLVALAPVLEVV